MKQLKSKFMITLILCLLTCICNLSEAQQDNELAILSDPTYNPDLDLIAEDTWNYLHSDYATVNHLPYSWQSASNSGGDFSNPAEIGLYALSWIAAFDLKRPWSPSWNDTENNVTNILDILIEWQNGSNAYNNSVFYQWYWIRQLAVGNGKNDNNVSSVDNAWLALSLITIREYAKLNNHQVIENKSDTILRNMNFRLWYHPDTYLFHWGAKNNPQGGIPCDYYSNENRIINFVARSLDQLSPEEFNQSLAVLEKDSKTYENITVKYVNYNGAYFTYSAPALFISEMDTPYGRDTIIPATQAQIVYADPQHQNYSVWGLSDCFDLKDGGYVSKQGSPPKNIIESGSYIPETRQGLVTPYASALALITPYESEAIENLKKIKNTFPCAYDESFGFHDSVMADPTNSSYKSCSNRFSALGQEWTFLAIANHDNGFIWRYLYKDSGVKKAHMEMYGEEPVIIDDI